MLSVIGIVGAASGALELQTASGETLQRFGQAHLHLNLPGVSAIASARFEVANVHMKILSMEALIKLGHAIMFTSAGARMRTSRGETVDVGEE